MPQMNVYGLKLNYTETGSGDNCLLFIHGWCSNLSSFQKQIKHFSKDYRCIAVDLPGFGKSAKPQVDFTMTIYGEVLNEFCAKLKMIKPTIIGHSLGALVALEMSWQKPQLPGALIFVDPAPIIMIKEIRQNMRLSLDNIKEHGFEYQLEKLKDVFFFLPTDDIKYKENLLKNAKQADQHAAESIWAHMIDYDGKRALKSAQAPIAYISGLKHQNRRSELLRYQPDMAWAQVMMGSHHCHQTEPDQVNAMIASYISTTN